jgi:D-beta-D-heptose 7-phosphate kinase/D-beta-D-heptose 1-phosphate adenosyltransferase
MKRAIIAAGWEEAPGGLSLREYSLIPVRGSPRSLASPRFWERNEKLLDVELSASLLVTRPAPDALPASAAGLFRGCLTAADDVELCRAARRADGAALRSRVITDFAEAERRCAAARRAGRTVVFTNGVFDLFHLGHVRLLSAARAHGDFLVVGINSDASARGLKGKARPVVPQFARAELVASVRAVDLCVIFDQPDPLSLLGAVRPAVLAKGSEYSLAEVVGRDLVEQAGGRVVLVPHVQGWSATSILRKLRGRKV